MSKRAKPETIQRWRKAIARDDAISRVIGYMPKCSDEQLFNVYLSLFRRDKLIEDAVDVDKLLLETGVAVIQEQKEPGTPLGGALRTKVENK